MNTKYGVRGAITPADLFRNVEETFVFEGLPIELKDGVIAVGFDVSEDADRARAAVNHHLAWFGFKHGIRCSAVLDQPWEIQADNTKVFRITMSETVRASADIRIATVTTQGPGRIVTEVFDSAKLATYSALGAKSHLNPALAKALFFFIEEVVDDDRPLYGAYKALEELSHAVGGHDKLAGLVDQHKRYVDEVMETAEHTRHAHTQARHSLSDGECRERTRILIEAYADSI